MLSKVHVDIGVMDYGLNIDGIIRMDLLLRLRMLIDLDEVKLSRKA